MPDPALPCPALPRPAPLCPALPCLQDQLVLCNAFTIKKKSCADTEQSDAI